MRKEHSIIVIWDEKEQKVISMRYLVTSLTFEHYFEGEGVVDGPIAVAIRSRASAATISTCCGRGCLQITKGSILAVGKVPSFARTLVIRDIEAISAPTHPIFLGLLDGVDEWFHPLVVIRVGLHEIYDIEAVDLVFPRVLHPKEEPLGEAISAVVVLEVQVVFAVTDLDSLAKVSALKATFKNEGLILILWLPKLVKRP